MACFRDLLGLLVLLIHPVLAGNFKDQCYAASWVLTRDQSTYVLHALCTGDSGITSLVSIDLGLCLGNANGTLALKANGHFGETCTPCSNFLWPPPATWLLCNCEVPDGSKSISTIPIDHVVEVTSNGSLTCSGSSLRPVVEATHIKQRDPQLYSGFQSHCDKTWEVVEDTVLFADCRRDSGEVITTDLPLEFCFANVNGVLTPRPNGGLHKCRQCKKFAGSQIGCECQDSSGVYYGSAIQIDNYIGVKNGVLRCAGGDGFAIDSPTNNPPANTTTSSSVTKSRSSSTALVATFFSSAPTSVRT